MKTISINVREPYLGYILSGEKTVEGRLNKGKFKEIEIGDVLSINDIAKFKIIGKRIYNSFEEMIEKEEVDNVVPDKKTIDEAVDIYHKFYSPVEEKEFGVVAIEIVKIE